MIVTKNMNIIKSILRGMFIILGILTILAGMYVAYLIIPLVVRSLCYITLRIIHTLTTFIDEAANDPDMMTNIYTIVGLFTGIPILVLTIIICAVLGNYACCDDDDDRKNK